MKPILLDIMLKGSGFYRQLKYDKPGFPQLVDGEIKEVYDYKDFQKFVEEKLPSLKHREYHIEFSSQRV